MYEFWYDYVKSKYGEKIKVCYMDTDSFIFYTKMVEIYKKILEDVERLDYFKLWIRQTITERK